MSDCEGRRDSWVDLWLGSDLCNKDCCHSASGSLVESGLASVPDVRSPEAITTMHTWVGTIPWDGSCRPRDSVVVRSSPNAEPPRLAIASSCERICPDSPFLPIESLRFGNPMTGASRTEMHRRVLSKICLNRSEMPMSRGVGGCRWAFGRGPGSVFQ